VQRRVKLLDTKAPIALNYLVALKDLLSILEESIGWNSRWGKNKGSIFHASQ
jgi:hypothetical protein